MRRQALSKVKADKKNKSLSFLSAFTLLALSPPACKRLLSAAVPGEAVRLLLERFEQGLKFALRCLDGLGRAGQLEEDLALRRLHNCAEQPVT